MVQGSSSGKKERRSLQRILLKLPARFRKDDQPDTWYSAITRDLSAAGILMEAEVQVDVSIRVVILLSVPAEQVPRQIAGLVTRSELEEETQHFLIGVNFIELDDEGRHYISAALRNTDIMGLLRLAASSSASDLHLAANHPPLVRVAGKLKPLRSER